MKKIFINKLFLTIAALGTVLLLQNCISTPMPGLIFSNSNQHVQNLSSGNKIGDGRVMKRGESCSWGGLGSLGYYFGSGGSIKEAMARGGIKKIAVVDRKSIAILGILFFQECVVVWGE